MVMPDITGIREGIQRRETHQMLVNMDGSFHYNAPESISPEQRIRNANVLLDGLNRHLGARNLHALTPEEFSEVRSVVDLCYRTIQKIGKEFPNNDAIRTLHKKTLVVKLGGRLDPHAFENAEFKKFILTNHLHHAFQAMGIQMTGIPVVLESGAVMTIPWDQLTMTSDPVTGDKIFRIASGAVAFRTDMNLKLLDDYTINYQGINPYNKYTTPHLLPVDRRDPAEWDHKFLVEIMTIVTQDPNEVGGCSGQHAMFILKNDQGDVYTHGLYGPFDTLTSADYLFFVGRKAGCFMAPDDYSYFSADAMNTDCKTFELTSDQFDRFFDRFTADRNEENITFSLFQNNCNSYIQKVMREMLGIHLSSDISLAQFIFEKLPQPLKGFIRGFKTYTYDFLPYFMKPLVRAILFPVYYVISVSLGMLGKVLALWNHEGIEGTDMTLWNIFTLKSGVDHPLALRESLNKLMPESTMDCRDVVLT